MKAKFILFTSVIIILVSFYFLNGNTLTQQSQKKQSEQVLPKNPMQGRIVFEQKGCIDCHAVNGYGGKTAPDFGTHNFFGSNYDLISAMWNHSPEMLKQMNLKNIDKQDFSPKDFQNLGFFLRFLPYLGSSGNASKGKELFNKMSCSSCHSVGKTNSNKINLNKIGANASPIYLAQVMWNHASIMQKTQKQSGIKVPVFRDNEFADLSSYIESVST